MSNFDSAFEIVVGHEGGYTNDRRDRGNWTTGIVGRGRLKGTKYGIAAHAYPQLDIRNLTLADAKAIYKRDYWDKLDADSLGAPLALVAFDTAINSGVARARRLIGQTRDWRRYLALRLAFLRSLRAYRTFGRGWEKRVRRLEQQAEQWERRVPRIFMRDLSGQNIAWDGRTCTYGGVRISAYPDGAIQLERSEG